MKNRLFHSWFSSDTWTKSHDTWIESHEPWFKWGAVFSVWYLFIATLATFFDLNILLNNIVAGLTLSFFAGATFGIIFKK